VLWVSGSTESRLLHDGRRPGNQGGQQGSGSLLTHKSHGPTRPKPEAQSSSPSRNQGQPTAGRWPGEALARQAGLGEAGPEAAMSMAGLLAVPTALLRQGLRLLARA